MVLLALDLPLKLRSGSYWYAGFPVPLGPTSRDDLTVRRPSQRVKGFLRNARDD